ncbi:hypothetical protein J5O04_07165 [Corynebacterium hindlerae]|uniref:Rv2732c family membrane protein n=1 Tax=Corynebacterium hindlerae TaxID=699041 RepID=UPI001AD77FB4|nr:hypothetical protein [Corynebacterium hindlerae]QTH58639.1 hypothetical protein J5O04_07165 [Corynebacterium hindlerae]
MSETSQHTAHELAQRERNAARRIDMSGYRVPLIGGALAIVASWLLPYTGNMTALDIAFLTERSFDYGISTPERIFVWLCVLGPVALTLTAYFRKSTMLAQLAWALSGIAMFFSIFAIWMRQTRDQGSGAGVGLILAAIAVLFVVYGLYNVVTMRTEEQEEIAELRRKEVYLDPVAQQQAEAFEGKNAHSADERGPIDDRRARNAQRRAQQRQQDS